MSSDHCTYCYLFTCESIKRCSHADIFQLINCYLVYHYIFQTCQEIIMFIPHRMKKHISLPDPIEKPAQDPVPGIETEL